MPPGLRLQRMAIAWIFGMFGMSLRQQKAIIRELLGAEPPAGAGAKHFLAALLAGVANYHPKVFFAFPVAVLVVILTGLWRLVVALGLV